MKLSYNELKNFCDKTTLTFDASEVVQRFNQDTRKILPGDIYVAIKGEHFDGHDYVAEAFAKGARAALVETSFGEMPNCLYCKETIKSFSEISNYYRKKFSQPVIAIAGSNGKTTTKEFLAHVLRGFGQVIATEGNLNNHIGVPLTLCRMNDEAQYFIIETGMNHFEELRALAKIVAPTHALVTSIGYEHVEFLGGTLEGVAKAEAELFEELSEASTALVNLDEPLIAQMPTSAKKMTYGFDARADVRVKILQQNPDSTKVEFAFQNQNETVNLKLVGEHQIRNAVCVLSVGLSLNLNFKKLVQQIQTFEIHFNRGRIFQKNGWLLIDDTYNANPDSMKASFETLKLRAPQMTRIGVLGGMGELGFRAADLHREVGLAAQGVLDEIWSFGENAELYHEAFHSSLGRHFQTHEELATALRARLQNSPEPMALLFKGSRSMRIEKILESVKAQLGM